jgi:hypothetical protein
MQPYFETGYPYPIRLAPSEAAENIIYECEKLCNSSLQSTERDYVIKSTIFMVSDMIEYWTGVKDELLKWK